MGYQSNLPQVTQRMRQASNAGLLAAAAVVENRVKDGLRGGYTSGNFTTGASLAAVAHSEPAIDANGAFILVGTSIFYAIFWELGFFSIFSRKFERVEIWLPALHGTRTEQLAAYQRAYQRVLGGGASGQRVAASPRSPR